MQSRPLQSNESMLMSAGSMRNQPSNDEKLFLPGPMRVQEFDCIPPAIADDHTAHMVRADHHPLRMLIAPTLHHADHHHSHVLLAPTPHCAGFSFNPTTALRMTGVTGVT